MEAESSQEIEDDGILHRMWPVGAVENGEILDVLGWPRVHSRFSIPLCGKVQMFWPVNIEWEHQMALLMDREIGMCERKEAEGTLRILTSTARRMELAPTRGKDSGSERIEWEDQEFGLHSIRDRCWL